MNNIDNLYKSYVAKCKEMKIKPGTKRSVFGDLIEKEEIAQRESIEEKSKAKKAPVLKLSDEAVEALEKPKKAIGIEEIKQSDFIKPEHYFDYLEVQKILNEMRRAG